MITAVKNTSDTFHISSLEKDVKLKPYTRAISRAYEEALLRGVIVKWDGSTDTPAINGSKAEEEMIRLLFGLSLEDMDNIEHDDYQELRRIVDEKNTEKKSKSLELSEKSEATLAEAKTA